MESVLGDDMRSTFEFYSKRKVLMEEIGYKEKGERIHESISRSHL